MKNELLDLSGVNNSNSLKMTSWEIAEVTGKRHDNVVRDIEKLNKSYENLQLLKIEELFRIRELPNGGHKKESYYELTKMQTMDLMTGYNTELRIKVNRRWEELENNLKNLHTELSIKEKLCLDIMMAKSDLERAVAINKYELGYVKPLENKVEHQKEVIVYMTDDVKLQTQRQFLNEIIKMRGNKDDLIRKRWAVLYEFYEKSKGMRLNARLEAYNATNPTKKIKSKLQFVDEVLRDIPTLYKIAVKTFEADFKDKLQHYLSVL